MLLQARCDDPLTQLSVQYHMIWGITVRNLAVAIIKVMYVSSLDPRRVWGPD